MPLATLTLNVRKHRALQHNLSTVLDGGKLIVQEVKGGHSIYLNNRFPLHESPKSGMTVLVFYLGHVSQRF